jgi:peptidoglycan/LPS O-acetylase OafA/YrhL
VKIASALLLCYVADPGHSRARLLSASWLRWCGIISYEWYLLHQPLTVWSRAWFGQAQGNLLKYAALVGGPLILGLVLAALMYKFFSLPILRQGRAKHLAEKPTGTLAATVKLQKS